MLDSPIDRLLTKAIIEGLEGVAHNVGVDLPPIVFHDQMQHFVDETHGVDLSRFDSLLREVDQVALIVDALGEDASRMEVSKDDVSGQLEKCLVEAVPVSRFAGDVEFEVAHRRL